MVIIRTSRKWNLWYSHIIHFNNHLDILYYCFVVSPWPYMTDGVVVLIPPGHPSVGCVETSTLSRGSWWFIWAMWQLAWWSICGNPQREGWGHLMGWGILQGLNSNILWQDFFWTRPTSFFAFRFFCRSYYSNGKCCLYVFFLDYCYWL